MEQLNQVWEKLSLDGLVMEQLNQVWEKLSLDCLVNGEAESGLGETESGWFGKWRS